MKKAQKILCCLLAAFMLCLFGCNGCNACKKKKHENEEPPVKEGFGIYGVADATITAGKFFDVMDGITAQTESGADITANITVSGELNTSRVGTYTLTYSVSHQGESESLDRHITVAANPAIGYEPPTFVYEAQEPFNIAKGCAVTASETDNGSQGNAVDGDAATRWESNQFGAPIEGEHIVNYTVDLGEVLPIEGVVIDWESAYAKRFALQVSSDGRTYTTLQEVEDNAVQITDNHAVQSMDIGEGVTARYVRLHCMERVTQFGYSIWGLRVFGKKGTVLPEEEFPVLYQAKNEQAKDWKKPCEQEIVFDLGSVKTLGALTLSWLSYLSPASFGVLYSENGTNYTQVGLVNRPYSADSYFLYTYGESAEDHIAVAARYVKVQMHFLRFYVPSYRITEAAFYASENAEKYAGVTARATSEQAGHEAAFAVDGDGDTYWENENGGGYQTIDLGESEDVGRIDLYWRGDDGGKGKYYDLQASEDGKNYTTIFRQTHGATQKQSVYYYGKARYLRVIDYQCPNSERYMLEGMEVFSQYPDGYESRISYDTSVSFPQQKVLTAANGNGSYVTDDVTFPSARLVAYLDDGLRDKPIPTNDWWQGLLMRDKGYNMYLNPLVATYANDGLWLTNPGRATIPATAGRRSTWTRTTFA